jgi:hypothetical protein
MGFGLGSSPACAEALVCCYWSTPGCVVKRQVFFLFIVFLFAFAALFPLALVRGAVP